MKKSINIFYCILFIILPAVTATNVYAQNKITKSQQEVILKEVCEKLEKYYTNSEIGAKLSKVLIEKFEKGGYSENVVPEKFTEVLNEDFYETSGDKHLKIIYDPEEVKELSKVKTEGGLPETEIRSDRLKNFGFKDLRILDGNVGYMNISDFCPVKYAGEKAVTAMNFFSDCNSLVIDLRQNGGGSDDMVTFLASYFVDSDEAVVFNISYSTVDGSYYPSMTSSYLPGKKRANIPVYLLTSSATASAAEAFATIMKGYNKNVTIVGRKTRGAENPVNHLAVGTEYVLRIPSWRKIFSGMNATWEGKGISPDINVEENKALSTAHLEALKKMLGSAKDKVERDHYQWAYDGVKALLEPFPVDEKILRSYQGKYGNRNIYYGNGNLYYDRERLKLIPIVDDYFLVESIDYFRIKFIKENGRVIAFERIFIYGYSSRHTRD
jgi:hypothetical protein